MMLKYWKYSASLLVMTSATASLATDTSIALRDHPFWQFDLEENRTADVTLADVDGDGDLDILTANGRHWAEQDFVYLNSGDGRMLEANYLGHSKSASYTVQAGDLDGNGTIDAVVVRDKLDAAIYLNDGAGKYAFSSVIKGSRGNARSAALVDTDSDNFPDLVVATRRGPDMIYRGNGKGGFDSGTPLPDAGFGSTGLAMGDLDHDGDIDIVIARRDDAESVVMFNQAGSFRPFALPESKGDHRKAVIAELTGDQYPDIVLADTDGSLLLYHGSATGKSGNPQSFGTVGDTVQALAAVDLDGDGDLDLFAGCDGRNILFQNDGHGIFSRQEFGAEADSYGVATGDMNGDGLPDIVVANSGSANQVFLNQTLATRDQ
jgi:hypothetical protein